MQKPSGPPAFDAASGDVAPGSTLVDRLAGELTAAGVESYRIQASELTAQLIAFFRGRGLDALLTWDHIDGLDPAGLIEAGFRLVRSADASVKAGLTGCAAAIAETGTLVLPGTKGQPLTASLLPEVHVAVIHSRQIVRTLEEALHLKAATEAAATVLITGPSRTADIEMTLTIGVHGPKELIAYIVE
jgi:L-lactate dehydrogenase complex protein LldG